MPIAWLPREARYVEKLATPDVTIADMIGDIDPIKAAQGRTAARQRAGDALRPAAARQPRHLRDQRAARPRRQDPGRPVQHPAGRRRPDQGLPGPPAARRADRLHRQPRGLHGARQDHHAAQGPHRRRDPHALHAAAAPRRSRSPRRRRGSTRGRPIDAAAPSCARWSRRSPSRRATERKIDKRSGVSQRMPISVLESVVSNAERRALANGESPVVPRVTDIYAALPSMTGKFELEYEGELKGADHVGARADSRAPSATCSRATSPEADAKSIVEWFDLGGSLALGDTASAARCCRAACGGAGTRSSWRERAGLDAAARRRRRWRRRSTSCSKACTRRRRSAATTSAAITAPEAPRRRRSGSLAADAGADARRR